ncbi:helix-turn-helix domain-containing protein [Pedobacter frigoris]|uniref:helix-turn-helix domain-containing protein n=1 Tax=Pedobacter frigoris TaxID=2571272 RepID=UPI00397745CE
MCYQADQYLNIFLAHAQRFYFHYHLCITMEYALALLQGGKQVKEVAIILGYTSPENFSRAFKKVFVNPPVSIMLQK